ncbi:MAG TPA: hypothetical protein VKZ74_06630 [Natronosporangium sp.]|nr:hypothetical protein [Natronosporangium sp.]
MFTVVTALRAWLRPAGQDRGETGPLGYAVMVSAIVLLAIFVVAWGEDVARFFMEQIEQVPVQGDPGFGGGGGE